MCDFTHRTELLIGKDGTRLLSQAKIILFGLGGVGSYTAEALVRCGIGNITVVDGDVVCPTNINRQLYALHSTIGKPKALAARERMLDINPNAHIEALAVFYNAEKAESFDFSDYDYVIDAIDDIKAKILIIENAQKAGVKVISSMGAANKTNPIGFEVADISKTSVCPLAKILRKHFKQGVKVVYSKEQPQKTDNGLLGSVSFVPPVVGMTIAGEVVRELLSH
jgi:tRNA A37 threonylcarbamoyladenosine dehydratase